MYGERLYYYSGLITALILIPIYVAVLLKARAGSKFKLVTKLVWLLITANLFSILFLAVRYIIYNVVQTYAL